MEHIIDVCRKKSLWKINYEEFESYLELKEIGYDDDFFITAPSENL